jgi:hypothetical protein
MKSNTSTAIAVAISIVALQVAAGIAIYFLLPDWTSRGQFGDLFGAFNATFSGLAFAGLIYAILLQREDLALQRTELELTRQELSRSAAAQELSEKAQQAQAEAATESARMSATTFLLEYYKERRLQMAATPFRVSDPRQQEMLELQRREAVLKSVLDEAFNKISNQGKRDE